MKKRITFLMAAFTLLAFLAIPMGMKGQSTYTKVATAPSDWSGTYVIVADDSGVIFTGQSGSNNYGGSAAVTISNNSVTGDFADYEVEIEKSGDNYTMKHSSSSKYLGWTSGNSLAFNASAPTANSYKWNLSTSSILNANDNSRKLQYNSGSPRFACYTSSQKVAYLYKKEVSSNTPTITANPVSIGYNQTSGSITYTIDPATGATITNVQVTESNPEGWLTVSTNYTSPIALTCQTNTTPSPKAAIVTLTCTFGNNQTTTKTVSVTQAGNPDVSGGQNDPYSVAEARAAIDANAAVNGVYATGIVSRVISYNNSYHSITYWISDDGSENDELEAFGGISGIDGWTFSSKDDIESGATVVIYGNLKKYNDIYEFDLNNQLVSYTAPSTAQASIAITPDSFELDANSHMGEVLAPIAYQNIVVVSGSGTESFDVQYYDAEGHEIEQTWCTVGAAAQGDTDFNLIIAAGVNEGNEARTAYFKLYGHDEEANVVYSNLITVTQAAPVIDYAVLPFVWEGGERSAFEALNGTSTHSVGDYAETQGVYRMKLDATGDYIQVKCDQQPGKITIGVKMVGGSNTSTITIQGSADGETFTDIEVLTISGAQGDELTLETTNAFADADRYVRMLFTKGSNVGVGPITIEKGSAPSIAVTPATLDLEASGSGQDGVQMQQFVVTYHNLDIESHSDFTVQFYDAEGEEQEQPAWITPNPAYVSGGNDEGYMVMLFIEGNTDVARSAYYKVSALDADENVVYSNLVTINQAGAPQQYTLTVEPFENLELITFVNEEMIMEGDGEITVTEGDEIMLSIVALEGYEMETLMVNGVNHVDDIAEDYTYTFQMPAENVTISATAVEDVPVTPGSWVLTNLTDLTENDVFVIVGTDADDDTFALPYNGGTSAAPSATAITIVENAISGEPAAELQWNLSGNTTDGYTFYPNGETETWLYCTNTNNGVRVGTNDNKTFKMDEDGYLVNDATSRVLSIYVNNGTPQDWRCYSNYNNNPVVISFYKKVDLPANSIVIEGYGDSERGGYYLIASPFTVSPTDVQGMTEGEYDLYSFDEAEEDEWRNYKAGAFENLEPGKGYLYAHSTDVTLTFDGEAYNGDPIVLKKTAGGDFEGWNLVGNPYTGKAYIDRDFYVMNPQTGDEIITGEGNEIAAMQGFFVIADHDGEELEISTEPTEEGGKIVMNVNSNRGNIIDRAMIRFGEGRQLPKFMLNEDNTKLYIAKGEEEYAVARNEAKGEMNLNFEAAKDGTYTLDFTVENVELDQLLLIDNKTGMSIDLLSNQSYTFEATTDDAAARFRIVFGTTTSVQEENINKFAFYNNGNLIINNNGNAILNIVDVLGRIISSYNINGSENVSINAKAGVYMLQLIQGDKIQTQKIVVE